MAHGVVPVVSRFAGAEDFIDGQNALTFPVGDIEAAASAIARLDRDRLLLDQLSEAARHSQDGIRTELGAIDAWADALRATLTRPARKGGTLPTAPRDRGLLTRLGVPDALAELVRGIRNHPHDSPGSEWPHWSGIKPR
jgi:hypothetical protein